MFGFDESKMTHGSANDVKDVNAVNEVNEVNNGKDANTMDVKQVNGAIWSSMAHDVCMYRLSLAIEISGLPNGIDSESH